MTHLARRTICGHDSITISVTLGESISRSGTENANPSLSTTHHSRESTHIRGSSYGSRTLTEDDPTAYSTTAPDHEEE